MDFQMPTITVNVPPQEPPIVNVSVPAPVVNLTVPDAPVPVINVHPVIDVKPPIVNMTQPAPVVNVHLPQEMEEVETVERDALGRISRVVKTRKPK